MDSTEAIRLENLSKSYGEYDAVRNLNLSVKTGEFVSLLGPSGCGKTTTLRMIAGFITPSAGSIVVGGSDITSQPANRRNVGLVFQNYALWPHMTVFENIAFGLRIKNGTRSRIDDKVREVLALTDLGGLENRRPAELSGGQQQRVALARALALEPPVMLMDEPLSNLDRKLRVMMRRELKLIQHRLNITTLFVTHDQEEALSMSDRVAIMDAGRLLRVATPDEIYENPEFEFVADFVGQTNILDATVVEAGDSGMRVSIRHGLDLIATPGPSANTGSKVRLMIRPEKIELSQQQVSGPNALEGTISFVEYQGSIIRYTAQISDDFALYVETQNKTLPFKPGQPAWIRIPPEHFKHLRPS